MGEIHWTRQRIFDFLEFYKAESILWDPVHPGFRDRIQIHAAWERILEGLPFECTIDDLKRKKDSLLASYRSVCYKMKDQIQRGVTFRPSWFAFEKMHGFLKGRWNTQPADIKHEMDLALATVEISDEVEVVESLTQDAEVCGEPAAEEEEGRAAKGGRTQQLRKPMLKRLRGQGRYGRWATAQGDQDTRSSHMVHLLKEIADSLQESRQKQSDTPDSFSRYIANKMKALDPISRSIVEHKINTVIHEAEVEMLRSQQNTQPF